VSASTLKEHRGKQGDLQSNGSVLVALVEPSGAHIYGSVLVALVEPSEAPCWDGAEHSDLV
jgi:hypothetical protein